MDIITNQIDLTLFLGIFVISIFILKNFILMSLTYSQGVFFKKIKLELSYKIFNFYTKSDFLILYKKNPSLIVRNITNEIQNLLPFLTHFLTLIRESSAVFVIFIMLLYFEPNSTILISVFFGVVSFFYIFFLKSTINKKSIQNQNFRNDFIQIVYETFGSIKDIKVMNKENNICNYFENKLDKYEKNLFTFFFLERIPRFLLEILTIFLISVLSIFYLSYSGNNISNLPSLSLFIVGAVRFLPAFSAITLSRYYLRLFTPSLDILNEELSMINNAEKIITREDNVLNKKLTINSTLSLELKNIDFKYPEDKKFLFKNLNFVIKHKDRIGISGVSGSGKSTLFDILLGLIKPSNGQVLINNLELDKNLKNWRKNIGFVSQNLFIKDSTFRENIAFNFNDEIIDKEKITKAVKISGLKHLIDKSPMGLDTSVGVNGLKLSGGERQRLALARAIYREPEIFFLDEFTSALDIQTEEEIFEKIFKYFGDKTFIIIAHRKSAFKFCNKIYNLEDGELRSDN